MHPFLPHKNQGTEFDWQGKSVDRNNSKQPHPTAANKSWGPSHNDKVKYSDSDGPKMTNSLRQGKRTSFKESVNKVKRANAASSALRFLTSATPKLAENIGKLLAKPEEDKVLNEFGFWVSAENRDSKGGLRMVDDVDFCRAVFGAPDSDFEPYTADVIPGSSENDEDGAEGHPPGQIDFSPIAMGKCPSIFGVQFTDMNAPPPPTEEAPLGPPGIDKHKRLSLSMPLGGTLMKGTKKNDGHSKYNGNSHNDTQKKAGNQLLELFQPLNQISTPKSPAEK